MPTQTWLPTFKKAAKAVGEAIKPLIGTSDAGEPLMVRGDGDVTRRVDALAEETAIEVLQGSGMPYTLVSEELGRKDFGKVKGVTIILDPLDGSANAIRGIPAYSFSVAFSKSTSLEGVCESLVADLANGVIYEAESRKGARCDGIIIHSSDVQKLSESMIGVDLNIVDLRVYMRKIIGVLNMARRKRYLGTNALELCLVACGKYDAFVDIRRISRVTDVAAAYLILKEAGGAIVDEEGLEVNANLSPTSRLSFIAAGNTNLCKNILVNLRRGRIGSTLRP